MEAKINKALDWNKVLEEKKQGKLLKKNLEYPILAGIKYDGNYTVIEVMNNDARFLTSGGHEYTPNNPHPFRDLPAGAYIAERIAGYGVLGDRDKCALTGPAGAKVAEGHGFRVFDYLTVKEYIDGISTTPYIARLKHLNTYLDSTNVVASKFVYNATQLENYLDEVEAQGYEGLMGKDPMWLWEDTTSRKVGLFKYKRRPTADLLCIGTNEGDEEKKYKGLIGALVLEDSKGRVVSVGSGLSDSDRHDDPARFIGRVIEIEYERLAKTYIQPAFIRIRDDKTKEEID